MTTEQRYTLAEAQRELNLRKCRFEGHDLNTIYAGNEPIRLFCGRCGKAWTVQASQGDA